MIRSPYRKPLGAGARPVHPILRHHQRYNAVHGLSVEDRIRS